jgi:hypothetical protein
MTLKELYLQHNKLVASKNFHDADILMQQILQIPDQPWQQYLYMPAEFYEAWGDYSIGESTSAVIYYEKALEYRRQIGYQATGSGEGMEAMYHIKRIQKKLKELTR